MITKKGNTAENLLTFRLDMDQSTLMLLLPRTLKYAADGELRHQGFPVVSHDAEQNSTLRANVEGYIDKRDRRWHSKTLERALLAIETHRDNLLKSLLEVISTHDAVAYPSKATVADIEAIREAAFERGRAITLAEVNQTKALTEKVAYLALLRDIAAINRPVLVAWVEQLGFNVALGEQCTAEGVVCVLFEQRYPGEYNRIAEWSETQE